MPKICCFCRYGLAFVGLLILGSPVVSQSVSDSVSRSISEVVLLDNGRVLQGQIARTVDQVHVRTSTGSRIILPAKRVDRIFDSLPDVWQYRASKLDADDVDGHLSLFHWCVKHQLKVEAQQQLDWLMQSKIDVRRLKFLDRQLARAFEAPKRRKKEQPNDSSDKSLSYLDVAQVFHPLPTVEKDRQPVPDVIFDQAFALASHTEPAVAVEHESDRANPQRDSTKKSIRSQLESMTELLAREDLHQFQRRVQPVLLKGCLAAKCHNSTATVMPLLHRGRGQLVPKRFTQRNLQSIVDWINPNQVVESRLVTQAVTAHGGQKSPAIQIGSKEFQLLSNWIAQIVKNSPDLIPDSVNPDKRDTIALVTRQVGENVSSHADAENSADTSSVRLKPSRKPPEPAVDPFDPSAFNRLPK